MAIYRFVDLSATRTAETRKATTSDSAGDVAARLVQLIGPALTSPRRVRLVALIPIIAALQLGGCGGSSPSARLSLTTARGHDSTACVSGACGPWLVTLNWNLPRLPGTTGYYTFLNGAKRGDVRNAPFTFTGSRCGVTLTLGVEAHTASGKTGHLYTTAYATPACGAGLVCSCASLRQIDGGPAYFAHIGSKSDWLDTVIPVGGWLEQPGDATEVRYDSAMDNNFYWSLAGTPGSTVVDYNTIRCPSNPSSNTVCAGGMHIQAPSQDANTGAETVGWQGWDESDGDFLAGYGNWDFNTGECVESPPGCGETVARFFFSGNTTDIAGTGVTLPYTLDGREVSQGFTGPVLGIGNFTQAQRQQFVAYSDFLSADYYFLTAGMQGTSTYTACQTEPSSYACTGGVGFDKGSGFTASESSLPANYAWDVSTLRSLALHNGAYKPVAVDVETGCPGATHNGLGNCATPPQSIAAAWQGLIAGARGVLWFQHNFVGPCETDVSFYAGSNSGGENYNCEIDTSNANICPTCSSYTLHAMVQQITAANEEIAAMTGPLLSPTAVGEVSTTGDVSVMAKSYKGNTQCYVFVGSGQPFDPPREHQSVTFHLADHYTGTITPVDGEGHALTPVAISNGKFTDTLADANSIHIYHVPHGC